MTREEIVECLSKVHPLWNRYAIESLVSRLESLNLIKFDPPYDDAILHHRGPNQGVP